METAAQTMSGQAAIRLLVDAVSEGGNLLLNVGPDEAGNIPELQVRCLDYMGDYMAFNGRAINETVPLKDDIAEPVGPSEVTDEETWIRWTRTETSIFAFVSGKGQVYLPIKSTGVDKSSAKLLSGESVEMIDGSVNLDVNSSLKPMCIELLLQ